MSKSDKPGRIADKGRQMKRRRLGRTVAIYIGLLATGLLVLVGVSYQHDIRQARKRVSVGSKMVETPRGPIEYAVAGDGPPVLVVHGAGGGFDQALDFAGALIQGGFRVVAPSRFGYPRTPLPADASPAAQADAYAWLLLFDAALKSDFLLWAAPRLAPRVMYRAILATPPEVMKSAGADERARVAEVLDHVLPFSQRRLGVLNDASITPFVPRYELERIAAPTLVLAVADDVYGTYEGARYSGEHIPHARFIGYTSGGHILVGHLKEAMSEIAAFLK